MVAITIVVVIAVTVAIIIAVAVAAVPLPPAGNSTVVPLSARASDSAKDTQLHLA